MATLHTALQSLSPTPFSAVPTSQEEALAFLEHAFQDACTIIDSVPLPPPADAPISRPRSSTATSNASNVSEISASSARSEPLNTSNVSLQKEWGKPIKLNAKDNPLGMSVYKCGGKDGRGAWFARRSVHEGLGFTKWKQGLQREFPETLESQGGPGDGNIRGIGGERRVERKVVGGLGTVEVYHLSAQFPGPTTPRDFVTLLLTSSTALCDAPPTSVTSDSGNAKRKRFSDRPRHFMVISRPCDHPDTPPRDGFIRGQYESVEFIREIPREKSRKSVSVTDLTRQVRSEESSSSMEKEAIVRSAMKRVQGTSSEENIHDTHLSPALSEEVVREGRQRGKTISFAGSRGPSAKGEKHDNPVADDDDESNPVEWIMITRSDPGGSVPRFMVERGTPGGIVADASKFLDWACKKEHPDDETEALEDGDAAHIKAKKREELEAYETNGHLAGLDETDGAADPPETAVKALPEAAVHPESPSLSSSGLFTSVAHAAYASLETYAPQAVIDRLPGHSQSPSMSASIASTKDTAMPNGTRSPVLSRSVSSISSSSVGSFASAEDHFGDDGSLKSTTSQTKSSNSKDNKTPMTAHEKELAKLNERKRLLNEKLAKAREKETKDKEELTSKEEERLRKAQDKHAQEVTKQEEKYKKEIAKLEAKRVKEAAKVDERRKRAEDRDEKAKLTREKEELRQELEVMRKERDIFQEQISALQRENTMLVARMGRLSSTTEEGGEPSGREMLKEVKADLLLGEGRRRRRSGSGSGSLRKEKSAAGSAVSAGSGGGGKEATVLAGEGLQTALMTEK